MQPATAFSYFFPAFMTITMDIQLLELLVCPENHTKLQLAPQQLIDKLNAAIANSQLKNRSGQVVKTPLQEGLVNLDSRWLYPVRNDIPVLLAEEAIVLQELP